MGTTPKDPPPTEEPAVSRRELLGTTGAALAGATLLGAQAAAAAERPSPSRARPSPAAQPGRDPAPMAPGQPGRDYQPVVVPNGAKLPWKIVDGVKVFHLVAEEVEHVFAPGLVARCWGYNGTVHGPLLEMVELDRVRIYVTNRLPAGTSVHWHGVLTPSGMDGVGGLNQVVIRPGETFLYEFTLRQSGTLMYHSHHDEMTQMAMGMAGLIVIHPRRPSLPPVARDYAILLHEWRIDVGTARPNPLEMTDFNVLTMNAKVFPATAPLLAQTGERVRIRLGNLSATDHHPIHLHGHQFRVTETDGGQIEAAGQWPETTVLVPVGSTRTIEFVAEPGDWALHCHMTHHMMNQMGHDLPNMVGVNTRSLDRRMRRVLPSWMSMGRTGMADMGGHGGHGDGAMEMPVPENSIPMLGGRGPYDPITMGGMATVLKVRDRLEGDADPGWYEPPPGTLAARATAEQLRRDGIETTPRPKAG